MTAEKQNPFKTKQGNYYGAFSVGVAKRSAREMCRSESLPEERAKEQPNLQKDMDAMMAAQQSSLVFDHLRDTTRHNLHGYLQTYTQNPFGADLCRASQIDMFNALCSNLGSDVCSAHFDGTCNCVGQKIKELEHQQRPENYSLVMARKGITTGFSVLDFIWMKQSRDVISGALQWFRSESIRRMKNPNLAETIHPTVLVTDDSLVCQEAVCLAFNGMSLAVYNDFSYSLIRGEKSKEEIGLLSSM